MTDALICFHCGRPLRKPSFTSANAKRHYCKSLACRRAYARWWNAKRKARS